MALQRPPPVETKPLTMEEKRESDEKNSLCRVRKDSESLHMPWHWRLRQWCEKSRLLVYTALLLLASVGNQLYFKRMTSAMSNYCFFLSMVSTIFYLPIFGTLSGRGICKDMTVGAIRRFAVMGVFDGLAGVFMILGGSHTSGTMQVLLSQGVIPCTVICSIILLSKRFHLLQYAGAGLIVGGIVLAKLATASGGQVGAGDEPFFNFFFFLACLPSALSSVFKEVAFRGYEGDLDVNVLQFWVAIFQTFMTIATLPLYTLPMLGAQQVPIAEMSSDLMIGARCLFLREDYVVENCGLTGNRDCDNCAEAWPPVLMYFLFNVFFNIFTMLVIKHGSATLSFLVSTLRMPLASIAFASTWLMGKDAVQPTASDLISLIVIISGLSTYRAGGRHLKHQLEQESSAKASSPSTWLLSDSPVRMASPGGTLRRRATELGWKFVPMVMAGVNAQPVFILAPDMHDKKPRSPDRVRSDLIHRLRAASPLSSPRLRDMTRPATSHRAASPPRSTEKVDTESPEMAMVTEDELSLGTEEVKLQGLSDTI